MYFISVQSTIISIGLITKGAVIVGPICTVHCSFQTIEYISICFEVNEEIINCGNYAKNVWK